MAEVTPVTFMVAGKAGADADGGHDDGSSASQDSIQEKETLQVAKGGAATMLGLMGRNSFVNEDGVRRI